VGSSPSQVKPKTIKIGIRCFSAKHAALRRKRTDWSNQNNVSEWSATSKHGGLFQLL
jgi:hypothetical protein